MFEILKSLQLVFTRRDTALVLICSILFFLLVFLLSEKAGSIESLWQLRIFSIPERLTLIYLFLISPGSSFMTNGVILGIAGSILGGLNLSFSYLYFKTRAESVLRSNLYSGTGLVLAFLGIGCAACGTALLASLLGILGLSSLLGYLPYGGVEVGYLGLGVLVIGTYILAQKITGPKVC